MVRPHKVKHFAPLNELASSREEFSVKVLELGGGSGANFPLVSSRGLDWTITEPNAAFAPYFRETVAAKGGKHRISELIEAVGEDLGQFEGDSFDAVIVTFVFCTVPDLAGCLREIRRVLKPGGKLYFHDHVGDRKGSFRRQVELKMQQWFKFQDFHTFRRMMQDLLDWVGLWRLVFDRCEVNRDVEDAIRGSGLFSKVEAVNYMMPSRVVFYCIQPQVKFHLDGNMLLRNIISRFNVQVYGWATK